MKKAKTKKLTREQKIIERFSAEIRGLNSVIESKCYELKRANEEADKYKNQVVNLTEAKGFRERKIFEIRGHVLAAVNIGKGFKPIMMQQEVYHILGKIQGRLEASLETEGYGIVNACTTEPGTIGKW